MCSTVGGAKLDETDTLDEEADHRAPADKALMAEGSADCKKEDSVKGQRPSVRPLASLKASMRTPSPRAQRESVKQWIKFFEKQEESKQEALSFPWAASQL